MDRDIQVVNTSGQSPIFDDESDIECGTERVRKDANNEFILADGEALHALTQAGRYSGSSHAPQPLPLIIRSSSRQ